MTAKGVFPQWKHAFVMENHTGGKMMKLRMTGFECSPTFVILRAITPPPKGDEARHRATKLVSVFQK